MARKLSTDDKASLVIAGGFLVWLTLVIGIGYIVIHFIIKFW